MQRLSVLRGKLGELASKQQGYAVAYPHLLDATRELTKLKSPSGYLAIAHMVYAWMPTILKTIGNDATDASAQPAFWGQSFASLVDVGRRARDAQTLLDAITLIESIPSRSPINGSWVGLSKFLHFINPEVFPIWDRRVAAHWGGSATWHNSKAAYRSYLRFCHQNKETHFTDVVLETLREQGKSEVSYIRAVELGLFVTRR